MFDADMQWLSRIPDTCVHMSVDGLVPPPLSLLEHLAISRAPLLALSAPVAHLTADDYANVADSNIIRLLALVQWW